MANEPRLIMVLQENGILEVMSGPLDLVVEVRHYDHQLEDDDPRLITDINNRKYWGYLYRADKEVELADE
jgi:hypothetical protein